MSCTGEDAGKGEGSNAVPVSVGNPMSLRVSSSDGSGDGWVMQTQVTQVNELTLPMGLTRGLTCEREATADQPTADADIVDHAPPSDAPVNPAARAATELALGSVYTSLCSYDGDVGLHGRVLCYGDSLTAGYNKGGTQFDPWGPVLVSSNLP